MNKQAYRYAYTMKPGATPIVAVRVVSGAFPEGLSLNSKGVLSGTVEVAGLVAGAKRAYPFTIRVTDANGLWACVSDTMTITTAEVICGTSTSYSGGQAFPNIVHVQLGSQTGLVTLAYATASNPDKFQVWIGGQKVIDTGYHGDARYQAQLDADLKNRGIPPETITQRPGGETTPEGQFANKNYETATFQKPPPIRLPRFGCTHRWRGRRGNSTWTAQHEPKSDAPLQQRRRLQLVGLGSTRSWRRGRVSEAPQTLPPRARAAVGVRHPYH